MQKSNVPFSVIFVYLKSVLFLCILRLRNNKNRNEVLGPENSNNMNVDSEIVEQ